MVSLVASSSFLLLLFSAIASSAFTSSPAWLAIRDKFAFDRQTKWDCFYRTTTPVKGMDPAIWRRDQFGNLLMAGLNFNCRGCLCYTFDHRYPISNIGASSVVLSIVELMSSIENCQALSFRANALKGSNDDSDVMSVINRFGCDKKTMALFEEKEFMGARAVGHYLLSSERLEQIYAFHENYVNGPNFLDPIDYQQSKAEYFKYLNKRSDIISKKIDFQLAELIKN